MRTATHGRWVTRAEAWRRVEIGAAVAGLALLLAACAELNGGSRSGPAVAAHPIEDVLVGDIRVVNLTSSAATVEVQTSAPLVCSVVYGPTTAYGSQSTDPAMGGLPHQNHSAPLRGLMPETTYHFRVQGTASDGTVYVSGDLTFTTPAAESEASRMGRNVAATTAGAHIAAASSTFGGSAMWAPQNAIDEDPTTEWSTAGDGDNAFLTVALEDTTQLAAVGFWSRTMGSSAQILRFQVVTDEGTVLGPFDIPGADRMYRFPVDVRARTLRFEVVTSSGGNTGTVEVAAYAQP